jgi:cell division protein FtsW
LWNGRDTGISKGHELAVDKMILVLVIGLTLFGLLMVYSASALLAQSSDKTNHNQFYFLGRQGLWAVVGFVGMAIAMRVDYRLYNRRPIILLLLYTTIVLLVAVLFMPKVNATHRWVRLGVLSFQPSEVAKLALVAFLAYYLEQHYREIKNFIRIYLVTAGAALSIIGLIVLEPDFGTALVLFIVFVTLLFQAEMPIRFMTTLAIPVVPALIIMLVFVPWRFQRLIDFVDPWKNQTGSSYQVVQSLISIGSGGVRGLGFAQGKQKLGYLPSPHTDFIFAVIGEELGLIGAATVVAMFALLAWRGFRAARAAPDLFGQLLGTGLTVLIIAQAFFNISVALSLVPTKGIPLPFISAGGSSLAISLVAAGILLNISKHEGT